MNPTRLFNPVILSSGAMTNPLDCLEVTGLVAREPDPIDRRGRLEVLTGQAASSLTLPSSSTQHVAAGPTVRSAMAALRPRTSA